MNILRNLQEKKNMGGGGGPQEFYHRFITSPEPKAQVSYCRPFSSVVRRP